MDQPVFDERLRLLEVRLELQQQLIGQLLDLLKQLTKPRRETTA